MFGDYKLLNLFQKDEITNEIIIIEQVIYKTASQDIINYYENKLLRLDM